MLDLQPVNAEYQRQNFFIELTEQHHFCFYKKIQISLEIREAPAPTKDEVTIYLNNLRLWINWWNAATKYMAEDLPAQIDPFTFTETAGDNFNNFINDDLAEDVNP